MALDRARGYSHLPIKRLVAHPARVSSLCSASFCRVVAIVVLLGCDGRCCHWRRSHRGRAACAGAHAGRGRVYAFATRSGIRDRHRARTRRVQLHEQLSSGQRCLLWWLPCRGVLNDRHRMWCAGAGDRLWKRDAGERRQWARSLASWCHCVQTLKLLVRMLVLKECGNEW